jgi:hypothetical protein
MGDASSQGLSSIKTRHRNTPPLGSGGVDEPMRLSVGWSQSTLYGAIRRSTSLRSCLGTMSITLAMDE